MDQNKSSANEDKEQLHAPERKISASEQKNNFGREKAVIPERKEISQEEKLISSELMREIELMEADEKTSEQAHKKAKKIQILGDEEKIEHLLKIAHEKGVLFAVQVAKKMNDPYLLDVFHDLLAREGLYKKLAKK
jgi:hypothetical protein